jgi:hypothetical protein
LKLYSNACGRSIVIVFRSVIGHVAILAIGTGAPLLGQANDYRVLVVSESGDIASWLRPTASGVTLDRVVPVGVMPSDIDGPHNVTAAADGRSYYITVAHGTRVRVSTLLFDQVVDRFLSTLPLPSEHVA